MLVTATSIRYEIAAPSTISCIDGGSISCEEDGDWTAYFSLHTGDTAGEFGGMSYTPLHQVSTYTLSNDCLGITYACNH